MIHDLCFYLKYSVFIDAKDISHKLLELFVFTQKQIIDLIRLYFY